MRKDNRAQSYFDQLAQTYNLTQRLSHSCVSAVANYILNRTADYGQAPVVDIGCGDAYFSSLLLSHYESSRCVLIDISEPMLERARQRLSSDHLLDRVLLVRADAAQLPLRSETAALGLMVLVVHLLPHPLVALRDVWRILRPGAVFFIVTYDPEDLANEIYNKYFPGYREIDSKRFAPVSQLSASLAESGFGDISLSKYGYEIEFTNVEEVVGMARKRPFSGLANYSDTVLNQKLTKFEANLRQHFGKGKLINESKVTILSGIRHP